LYWLQEWGYRQADYLVEPYLAAADEACCRYPGDEKRCERFVIRCLNRAKANYARELRAEADRKLGEAAAVDASGPERTERFPFKWILDIVADGYKGTRQLTNLLVIVKEMTRKKTSDQLIDALVGTGRFKRGEFCYEDKDKKGQLRSWPTALFKMDYGLAERRYVWKYVKANRLLRMACEAGIIRNMGKFPPENGPMVYCAGSWLTFRGNSRLNWFFKNDDHWNRVFREFKCS
jgi:hypothetical protein